LKSILSNPAPFCIVQFLLPSLEGGSVEDPSLEEACGSSGGECHCSFVKKRPSSVSRPFHGGSQLPPGEAQHSPPSREGPSKILTSKRRADQAGESVIVLSLKKDPLQSPVRFTAGASFPQGKPNIPLPRGNPWQARAGGDRLRWMRDTLVLLFPHPGCADPLSVEGLSSLRLR
jgi:hypothetical protein